MSTWYFLDANGVSVGRSFTGPDEDLAANLPEGCTATLERPAGWGEQVPPTPLERARRLRQLRDMRLSECDWIVTLAVEEDRAVPLAWRAYRQALRDIPQQPGFPDEIEWPARPGA